MLASTSNAIQVDNYVQKATLHSLEYTRYAPELPPEFQKSTIPLPDVKTGGYRKLRHMFDLDMSDVQSVAGQYFQRPNATPIVRGKGVNLTVPLPGVLDLPPSDYICHNPYEVSSDEDILIATRNSAMNTAQTLLHHVAPETREWSFGRFQKVESIVSSPSPWNAYLFAKWESSELCSAGRFAIFVIPPWIVAPMDMLEFINCHKFAERGVPLQEDQFQVPQWEKCQLMWAMINDYCFTNQVNHFALTTYEQWVFGGFSNDHAAGFVTQPYKYDSTDPTVLQMLLYWLHSSFGCPGGWTAPQVTMPLEYNAHGFTKRSASKRPLNNPDGDSSTDDEADDDRRKRVRTEPSHAHRNYGSSRKFLNHRRVHHPRASSSSSAMSLSRLQSGMPSVPSISYPHQPSLEFPHRASQAWSPQYSQSSGIHTFPPDIARILQIPQDQDVFADERPMGEADVAMLWNLTFPGTPVREPQKAPYPFGGMDMDNHAGNMLSPYRLPASPITDPYTDTTFSSDGLPSASNSAGGTPWPNSPNVYGSDNGVETWPSNGEAHVNTLQTFNQPYNDRELTALTDSLLLQFPSDDATDGQVFAIPSTSEIDNIFEELEVEQQVMIEA